MPREVREVLADDYDQVRSMLEKIEHGHIHIAVFGRVSVGKSALVNALLGEARFSTSPLHGETLDAQLGQWAEFRDGNVFLIDTPGINEVFGEARETLAHEVAERADLVIFVLDGDLTAPELIALRILGKAQRPVIVVLNKSDQYRPEERTRLLEAISARVGSIVATENIVITAAKPREQLVIRVDEHGDEVEELRQPQPDIEALKTRLWTVLEAEGKTLSALNASLFAGRLSEQVAKRVLKAKRMLGERVIRTWCIAKGVAVALNPIPVADLVAAAVVDASMVVHLSRLYGLPLTRAEAGMVVISDIGNLQDIHRCANGAVTGDDLDGASDLFRVEARHRRGFGRIHGRCAGGRRLLQHLCGRPSGGALPGKWQIMGRSGPQARRTGDPGQPRSAFCALPGQG